MAQTMRQTRNDIYAGVKYAAPLRARINLSDDMEEVILKYVMRSRDGDRLKFECCREEQMRQRYHFWRT